MIHACPNCRSEHVQSFRVAYEAGTSTAESKSSGMGIGFTANGDVGVGFSSGKTQTTNMSLLAQKVAPPEKLKVRCEFLFEAASKVPYLVILPTLAVGGLIFGIPNYLRFKKNKDWATRYAQWQRSWICHKCGHTFLQGVENNAGNQGSEARIASGGSSPKIADAEFDKSGSVKQDLKRKRNHRLTLLIIACAAILATLLYFKARPSHENWSHFSGGTKEPMTITAPVDTPHPITTSPAAGNASPKESPVSAKDQNADLGKFSGDSQAPKPATVPIDTPKTVSTPPVNPPPKESPASPIEPAWQYKQLSQYFAAWAKVWWATSTDVKKKSGDFQEEFERLNNEFERAGIWIVLGLSGASKEKWLLQSIHCERQRTGQRAGQIRNGLYPNQRTAIFRGYRNQSDFESHFARLAKNNALPPLETLSLAGDKARLLETIRALGNASNDTEPSVSEPEQTP